VTPEGFLAWHPEILAVQQPDFAILMMVIHVKKRAM
jgi:hypothetical protein